MLRSTTQTKQGRRRSEGTRAVGCWAACLVLLVTGCGPEGQQAPAPPDGLRLDSVPAVGDPGIRDLILGMSAEAAFPAYAADLLTDRCMRAEGFDYPVQPASTYVKKELFQPYGVTVEEAKRFGYRADYQDVLGTPPPTPDPAEDLEARGLALFGPEEDLGVTVDDPLVGGTLSYSTQGCLAEARSAVFGDLGQWAALDSYASNLTGRAVSFAHESDEMKDLNTAWIDCMAARGRPGLSSPDEPFMKSVVALQDGDTGPASEKEKAVAEVDAICQAELDYAAAREALEDRYLTAAVRATEPTMLAAREMFRAATERARIALAQS